MEKKFLKWCKKLIPGRSTMTKNEKQSTSQENVNKRPVDSHRVTCGLDSDVHHNVNMEKEVHIEGQGKTQDSLDISTDGCGLLYSNKSTVLLSSEIDSAVKCQDFVESEEAITLPAVSTELNTAGSDECGAMYVELTKKDELRDVELLKSEIEYFKMLETNLDYPLSEEEMYLIRSEVETELNKVCPAEFYDFCLITCDADYEEALQFRSQLSEEYNLKGCMLFDPSIASLGGDIFSQYEAMIERSTKVFFYHTENYKKDYVHLRIQNGAVYQQLWEKMRWNREKCVPVFPHGRHKLGLALSGVSGLDPTIPENLSRRMQATFTKDVRKICVLKEIVSRQKRPLLYKDLLGRYLQEYVKQKLSPRQQELGPHWKLKMDDESASELTGSAQRTLLGRGVHDEIVQAVTHSIRKADVGKSSENIVNAYDVSISGSSDVHVGPRIEVNIHFNKSDQ